MIIDAHRDAFDIRWGYASSTRSGIRKGVALPGVEDNRHTGFCSILEGAATEGAGRLGAAIATGCAARNAIGGIDQHRVALTAIADAEAVSRTASIAIRIAGANIRGEMKRFDWQTAIHIRKYHN